MSDGYAFSLQTKVIELAREKNDLVAALRHIVAHYEEAGENLEVIEAEHGPNYAAGFYEGLGQARDIADLALNKPRKDAALVNAAPDLLAELKKWEAFARDNYTDKDISWLAETRAAIAKAEGAA
jgi:hypothetical protein